MVLLKHLRSRTRQKQIIGLTLSLLFLYIIFHISTKKTVDYNDVSRSNDLFKYVDDKESNKIAYDIINNRNKKIDNNNNNNNNNNIINIENSNNKIDDNNIIKDNKNSIKNNKLKDDNSNIINKDKIKEEIKEAIKISNDKSIDKSNEIDKPKSNIKSNDKSNDKLNDKATNKNSKYGIYSNLFHLLSISKPKIEPLTNYEKDNKELEKFVSDDTKFTKSFLENLLPLSDIEKQELTKSFKNFKSGIKNLNLEYFGRIENDGIHKIEGTGIVMVGGYKFSWLSLLNIHQLRRRGSNLPIEVYIPDKREYDKNFCNILLPQLNAKCILGYEELPFDDFKDYFNLKRYEYKMMAILTSRFENILLLDADNVVIENPDKLFKWKNYVENQLILWPDTWQRTSNPFLFDLVNVTVDYSNVEDMNSYNLHDLPGAIQNPSTESGMILVNKKSQLDTLLIALYFNIFGFDYYYPLMTQGGAGQGDKDSYIFAAHGANLPVYQVKQGVAFLGRFNKQGDFISSALGQCNPTTEEEEIAFKNNVKNPGCKEFMFAHLSFPKFYPNTIGEKVQNKDEGNIIALDGVDLSYDFELQIWELMCQLVCVNYKKNSIQPDNPASTVLDSKFLASAKKMEYIQSLDIDNVCDKELLPHLEFMRGYFKYADRHTNQFKQDWEGKDLLNSHLQESGN